MKLTIGKEEVREAVLAWFDKNIPNHPNRRIKDDYNLPYELTITFGEAAPIAAVPEVAGHPMDVEVPLLTGDDIPL